MALKGKDKTEAQKKRRALEKAQKEIEGQEMPDTPTNDIVSSDPGSAPEPTPKPAQDEAPEIDGASKGLPPSPKMEVKNNDVGGVTPKQEGNDAPKQDAVTTQDRVRMAVARAILGWFRFGGGVYIAWKIESMKLPQDRKDRVIDRVGDVFIKKLGGPEALQNCYQVAIVLEAEAPEYFKMLSTPAGQLGAVVGWLMDIKQAVDSELQAAKVA